MTALEAFNALDNREVSRKEVEQVLTQAKAENNTAIIYRLSRVLNDSPEATHFEITITHYDSSVGLSGVQHTGDYREALDDCGRLRKGWKFVKGNVIKVEKKEKPKKGKTPKNILKLRTALSAPHQEDEIAFLAGAGIDYFEEAPDDQPRGLGKPIPAADIYKMITDKIIKMLKSTKASDYKKTWKDDAFFIPLNYDSKKPYRGVNRLLLQERIGFAGAFRNPYFLTFKQIKKHKGTLKKGAKGYEVIYYSIRYVVPADKNSGRKAYSSTNAQKVLDFLHKYNLPESEVTRIPMIRYYNVYNGADIENMDFKLDELQIGRAVPDSATENRAAQLIVENYPNPPAIKNEGNQAYYNPASDYIKLPKQEQFDTVNDYYRTLFHELTHSTGHNKRLNRGIHLMLEKDDYAKEELVAEFGAVFLSAWAGIMWYNNKNHAAYLKGWNSAIKEAQNDNKFLMRAASLAQQATDYILNLNAKGEPAFLAELAKINPEKEEKKTKKATKKPQKNTENPEHHKYFQEKKKEAEIQLKEAIERVKKKSRDPQGGLPSAEGSQLFKTVQSTQDPVGTLQDGRTEPLSEDKGTKKSLSRKKKEENFGLNASEAPVTSLPVPRQTLAQQLATRPEVRESFLVADEQMSLFLGALEKKTKDSLVITLTGKQGSGKTRFAFQFMNALAQRYRVGHASIEEHPESVLYEEKAYQYLNDTALEHITAQDVRSLTELDTMIRTNEVIVIDSFQKMRELAPKFEVDKDLRKKYDGKLFLVIFQQTADGKMRGGSKSQFDGDIILFTETFPDYRENYVYPDKNRYNKRPATELQYSIYEQRMLATAPEEPALPAHYEPTESEELNFEVL